MKNINSLNELIKEFEDIVLEDSNLIKNGSVVALKHVATGKYLSSIEKLCYTTGSKPQFVYIDIVALFC
jgi:dolichyl-phosphate-mannose--protein O-mannosyl transferase